MMFFHIIRYINLINYSIAFFDELYLSPIFFWFGKMFHNKEVLKFKTAFNTVISWSILPSKIWVSGALFLYLLNVFLANFQPPFLNWAKNFGPTFFLHCVDVILYSFHTHTYCPYFFAIDKNHKILDKFDLAIGLNIDKFLLKF